MLLLFELEELNSIYLDYIKQISQECKIYVVSKQLYLYFRYTLKINVDMASLKDNHIYICSGSICDTLQVYCQNLDRYLNTYGLNCSAYAFREIHKVDYEIEID